MAIAPYNGEIWKAIPSSPSYEASSFGRIRRAASGPGTRMGKVLVSNRHSTGRLVVSLSENGRLRQGRVHRLVAEAFGVPGTGKLVCHKGGNPLNNTPSNLYYGTHSDNAFDAVRHGTHPTGERNGNSRISDTDRAMIIADSRSAPAIAAQLGVHECSVYRVRKLHR